MKIKRLLAFVLAGTLCLSETAWALPDNGVGGVEHQIPEKYLAVPGEIELANPVEAPVEISEEEPEGWEDNSDQAVEYEEDSDGEAEVFEPTEEPEEDVFYEEAPAAELEDEPTDEPAEFEEYAVATVSNSSRYAAISNTLQDEIKMEIVKPATMYSYMPLTLKIMRTRTATEAQPGTDPVKLNIFVNGERVKEIECKYGSEQEIVIPGEHFPYSRDPKSVKIAIKDQAGNEVTSGSVTVEPLKDFEITLKKQIFTKKYGATESSSYYIYAGDFTATKDGVELAQFSIGAVTYEPKPDKEDAGSYPIEKLTSSKYGTLTVVKNEFSNFVIQKKWEYAYGKSGLRIAADGNQKSIDIKQLFYTSKNEEEPVFTLGTIDDVTAAKFKVQPKYENGKLTFTPKESQTKYEISIPFKAESKNYYFSKTSGDEMLTVTITAEPRTAPAVRTIDEQRKYFEAHPFDLSARDEYSIVPDAKKGIAGRLNSETEKNALNSLNLVRYIAGLNEVTITDEFAEQAQAATTLLNEVGVLTHTPKKPDTVSQEFYELGYYGTSHSNIGSGHYNLAQDVISGWMYDGTSSNIDTVGHRRWCLDPNMKATGFGHTGDYTSMISFDESNKKKQYPYSYIPWPAVNTPVEFFTGPWNVSVDRNQYILDANKIKVTMETSAGKTYTLTSANKNITQGYFNVNSGLYGYGPAIIFKPGVSFRGGDKVTVTISGLTDKLGNPEEIKYTVNFFWMTEIPLRSIKLNQTRLSLKPSGRYQLRATLSPTDNTDASVSDIVWSSSNEEVAMVDDNGLVEAYSEGTAKITAEVAGKKATCTVTVSDSSYSGGGSSSGGGGGSSSGGGGGGGGGVRPSGSQKSAGSAGPAGAGASANLPDYVVRGAWTQTGDVWTFSDANGVAYVNRWAAVYNPYANTAIGQSNYDWFWFDPYGRMITGWHLDADGNYYYLNEASDGTRGRMVTGWFWIKDADGVQRCYYFDPVADTGTRGKMMRNTVVDGYQIDANGHWVVNGVVQTK